MSTNPFNPNSAPQANPFSTGLTFTFFNPATNKPVQCSPSSSQTSNTFFNPVFSSNAPFMSSFTPAPSQNTQSFFANPIGSSHDRSTSFMDPSSIECFEKDRIFHEQILKELSNDKKLSETALNNIIQSLNQIKLDINERSKQLGSINSQLAISERNKKVMVDEINKKKEQIELEKIRIEAAKPKEILKFYGPEFNANPFCESEDWLISQLQFRESQLTSIKSAQEAEMKVKERKYENELKRLVKEKSKLRSNIVSREKQLNNHKQNIAFQKILRTEKPKLDLPPITFHVTQASLPPLPETNLGFPYFYPILVLLFSIYIFLFYN